MSVTYTASIVGGGWGGRLNIEGLTKSTRFKFVALADTNLDVCRSIARQHPDVKTFPDHQQMFAECPTDVVCIATYAPSHEEITKHALQLPLKGIVVEKPLGATWAAGKRILDAVKTLKLPMAVPHPLLALRGPLEIIHQVHNGVIGDLRLVEIQQDKWDLLNAGIHWLNFFYFLTGKEDMDYIIAACDSGARTYRDGMRVETLGVTYGQTRSGVRVVMNTGDHVLVNGGDTGTLFRLIGTQGQIEFWGVPPAYRLFNAQHPQGTLFELEEFDVFYHHRHLENLADQIESGQLDYSIPDSSLAALELCEAAYISSRHRCKVTLPLSEFQIPEPVDWDPGTVYDGVGGGRDGRALAGV